MNRCFTSFCQGKIPPDLFGFLSQFNVPKYGLYKCRVLYDKDVIMSPEFVEYNLRSIQTLKLISAEIESKEYKPSNRDDFNKLHNLRGNCDDVLILRNGFISDTSYSNVALFDGSKWITPESPLIFGTNRAFLIDNNEIIEGEIHLSDLPKFKKIRLFNAMIEFGEIELDCNSIALK